jgi:polysaccharide chain length determinant protein (PEP-CTERM system associated)
MPEEFDDKPSEGIDFEHYLALGRRRVWYFLPPLFLGWLVVWVASWVMPSVYRSSTLILVEQPTVPQQYVVSNINGSIENRLDSITQQILSRTRLLRIIEKLNLYANERGRVSADELVERLRNDIEIELVRSGKNELTSFNVYYSARDPHIAQEVTSELTSLFISENLEIRQQQSENTTKFLTSQLEEARRNLAEQEGKVREFKDKHLGELPGQLQSNLQILSGLQGQLQAEEDTLNRAKQQNVYLESLLGQYRNLRRAGRSGDNTVVGLPALDQELDKLKAQLADLSSHYTERHPDVRKLKEQIAKTERLKQQITANLQSGADTSATASSGEAPRDYADLRDTSPMMELQSQLKANQIEIANRQRSIQDLKARIGDYQGRLNQAPVREQQLTDLNRGYEQSKADYDSLLKKKNDSELATSLELQQQGEHFRIVDPPNVPDKPYSPNRLKLFGIGLVAGLVLGGVFAAGAELTDDRIYSEKEFKKLVAANVIAEIPSLTKPEEDRATGRRSWLGWLGAGLIAASMFAGFVITYFRG